MSAQINPLLHSIVSILYTNRSSIYGYILVACMQRRDNCLRLVRLTQLMSGRTRRGTVYKGRTQSDDRGDTRPRVTTRVKRIWRWSNGDIEGPSRRSEDSRGWLTRRTQSSGWRNSQERRRNARVDGLATYTGTSTRWGQRPGIRRSPSLQMQTTLRLTWWLSND